MTDFSQKQRKQLSGTGASMPDGSFPIRNKADLHNAIQSVGRAKNYSKAKAHIISRAKVLGLTSLLPDSWKISTAKLSAVDSLKEKKAVLDQEDVDLILYLSEIYNDDLEVVQLSRQHPLAVVPGKNNWIEKTSNSGIPDYISRIALALIRKGISRSRAISTAIATVKRWAAGLGEVNADTRARASKAVVEWEALKAKNKARVAANKVSKSTR